MIHCRMSALGHVVGGAETVIYALLDALGPGGTLVAYIGWQDAPPDDLEALDPTSRSLYLAEQPVYDPRRAQANRAHGRVAEALRTWPGALHSGHPEAGIAALGPNASVLTVPHAADDAYGANTPYARLVELGGQVVLLGAPLDTVTLIHHAEAVARVPNKRRVRYRVPVLENGTRRWRTFSDIDTGDGILPYERVLGREDYIGYLVRTALASGIGRRGPLGDGIGHVLEARPLVGHAVAWLEETFAR